MPSENMKHYLQLERELDLAPVLDEDEIMDEMDKVWLLLDDDEHAELNLRKTI